MSAVVNSQRFEDLESLFDEILDEEEGLERKRCRLNKIKKKETGTPYTDDDNDLSYDDIDDDEEDLTDNNLNSDDNEADAASLRSYKQETIRESHQSSITGHFNKSTADFNKEIRQINKELL